MRFNYFYCPECGFEYVAEADHGYFGEAVHRVVPQNPIDGRQVDYLMHCPMCNAHTCGVVSIGDRTVPELVNARSVIAYCVDKPAIKNVS